MAQKKKNLLSIGRLSKVSGVHIKSLRYYDELGILRPAYVDPDSKYRYYDISQIYIVEAIQLCIELDIPLRQFTDFLVDGEHQIDYDKLMTLGIQRANQKIKSIQDKLAILEEGKRLIKRSISMQEYGIGVPAAFPEKVCMVTSCEERFSEEEYAERFGMLYRQVYQLGLHAGTESGILSLYGHGHPQHFAFVDIRISAEKRKDIPNLMTIPAQCFVSVCMEKSSIYRAPEIFKELFMKDPNRIVLETVLYMSVHDTTMPKYDLRCSY